MVETKGLFSMADRQLAARLFGGEDPFSAEPWSPSMASSGVKLLFGFRPRRALMYYGHHLPAMTTQADSFIVVSCFDVGYV